MALLDYLFPPQDNQMMGLLGGDEEKMRQSAQRAGLLNTGLGIIAASGPSNRPQGLLQPVATGIMAGQQAYQGTMDQQMQQAATRQKLEREANFRKAIGGAFSMSPSAEGVRQTQSNIDPGLLEGMSAQQVIAAAPKTERVLDQNKLMTALAEYNPLEFAKMQASRQTSEKESFRPMSADEKKQAGLPLDRPYQISTSGKIQDIGTGPLVKNVVGGESDPFIKEGKKEQAKAFGEIANSGRTAQRSLQDINRLESLLEKSPTGLGASAKLFAGNFGINTKGLSELQAAEALINKLVPQQRPPGSGTMSDADLELYKRSVVRIINQPGANKLIIESAKSINNYLIEEAKIANLALNGKISTDEAQERFAKLGNPVQDFFNKNSNLIQGDNQTGMPSISSLDAEIARRKKGQP